MMGPLPMFPLLGGGRGQFLYSASNDDTVRKIQIVTMDQVGSSFTGHTNSVRSVTVGEGFVFSGAADDTARKINPLDMLQVGSSFNGSSAVNALAFGGGFLFVGDAGTSGVVRKIDPADMQQVSSSGAPNSGCSGLIYGPDGFLYGSFGGGDGRVRKFDPATMSQTASSNSYTNVRAIAFGDGFIFAASIDDNVYKLDPADLSEVGDPFEGHTDDVTALAFGGGAVFSGSADETIRKIDPATMTQLDAAGIIGSIASLDYGKNNLFAANATVIRRYNPDSLLETGTFTGHTDTVNDLAIG